MKKETEKIILGTTLGVVAGAAAGVLLAPKSGKETRKIIGKKAKEVAAKGKEIAIQGKKLAQKEIKAAKGLAQKAKDKIK